MMCYRDKTYCQFWVDCVSGRTCPRALTDKVENDANNFGLPICSYCDEPKCFENKFESKRGSLRGYIGMSMDWVIDGDNVNSKYGVFNDSGGYWDMVSEYSTHY